MQEEDDYDGLTDANGIFLLIDTPGPFAPWSELLGFLHRNESDPQYKDHPSMKRALVEVRRYFDPDYFKNLPSLEASVKRMQDFVAATGGQWRDPSECYVGSREEALAHLPQPKRTASNVIPFPQASRRPPDPSQPG